jgi:ABC-type sugar transport system permease subunit
MGVITNSVRRLKRARFSRQSFNETLVAWVFILPSLIGIFAFSVLPTVRGIALSFTNSDLLTRQDFIGLKNYQNLIVDKQFWQSLGITLEYVLLNIPFQTILALVLAVMMVRLTKSSFFRGVDGLDDDDGLQLWANGLFFKFNEFAETGVSQS